MEVSTVDFRVVARMLPNSHRDTAWQQYESIVRELSTNRTLLEIGAGRSPLITLSAIKQRNIDYVANDIIEEELNLIPFPVRKAHFDICGDLPPEFVGLFDVICSKMVQEHVQSGDKFYRNIFNLLKSGGVALNFHPTLYCPPFLVNLLLPEFISKPLVQKANPQRVDDKHPKFPATYELCYSNARTETVIQQIGFSQVSIFPFYHHEYFQNIPLVRNLDDAMSRWAQTRDFRLLSSYAYTVVKK